MCVYATGTYPLSLHRLCIAPVCLRNRNISSVFASSLLMCTSLLLCMYATVTYSATKMSFTSGPNGRLFLHRLCYCTCKASEAQTGFCGIRGLTKGIGGPNNRSSIARFGALSHGIAAFCCLVARSVWTEFAPLRMQRSDRIYKMK